MLLPRERDSEAALRTLAAASSSSGENKRLGAPFAASSGFESPGERGDSGVSRSMDGIARDPRSREGRLEIHD